MGNYGVFVVLTPCDQKNKAESAFALRENEQWYCPATGGVAKTSTIDSREPTPAENENESWAEQDQDTSKRLIITFKKLLDTNLPRGVQFGTNPKACHVLLGHRGTQGVSARHCNIMVDDNLCIWLHDYCSSFGTAVGYGTQCTKEVRKREKWLLRYGPGISNPFEDITIHVGRLSFTVEFPHHETGNSEYITQLQNFANKCRDAELNMDDLDLASALTTAPPSHPQTPSERTIYYEDQLIGKGTFGEVYKLIRLRDGECFAAKTFKRSAKRKRGEDPSIDLRREVEILQSNPHVWMSYLFLRMGC
jgi:hypothetical protein